MLHSEERTYNVEEKKNSSIRITVKHVVSIRRKKFNKKRTISLETNGKYFFGLLIFSLAISIVHCLLEIAKHSSRRKNEEAKPRSTGSERPSPPVDTFQVVISY
ncbi:Activin receptor [Trichinella spiralis]|uniref:Activin receptor n=1 Tax=Trichinella spiralis TaxID=6334 RepID=A0ABR3KB11_TRISP